MSHSSLALFGGTPVRPSGPPVWPRRLAGTDAVLSQLRNSGDWGRYHGPHCGAISRAISQSLDVEHVQLCSSGTVAVELALRAAQVGTGDEVILSAYDFKANFTNVALLGATPVLVDCREDDAQLSVAQVEAAITEKTKSIISSHLQGGLVEMAILRSVADRHGITLIEDVCQAPGATVGGRIAGTWGDVATFSFGGSKLVTAGRGGAVATRRPEFAQRIRIYTQRGNEAYPLSEMQAAVLLPQWKRLSEDNAQRLATVEMLDVGAGLRLFEPLSGHPPHSIPHSHSDLTGGLTPPRSPDQRSDSPVFYKVGFWYDPDAFDGLPRDRFCQAMRAEGIPFDPGFPGLHQVHARRRFRAVGTLPHATVACARVVMLHHPILLEGELAVDQIQSALDKVARHATMLRDTQLPCEPIRD